MKTSDFRISVSSEKLNEALQKQFGNSINIQNYDDEELIRASKLIENKIIDFKRSNFNSTLENEEYFKLQLMRDVINTRMQEVFGEAKNAKQQAAIAISKKKDKKMKEGWKGGMLGGLGAGAMTGWNPWLMGAGYLLGSKAGDDLFGEAVDNGTKAARHAMLYRLHHSRGDIDSAHHHRSMCGECGGMLEHDDLGECWMSHPHIAEGQPHSVDEGWGKALGYGAAGLGLGGLGAYALANPSALGGLGNYLGMAGKGISGLAGQAGKALSNAPGIGDLTNMINPKTAMDVIPQIGAGMYESSKKKKVKGAVSDEGNAFSGALVKAKADHRDSFKVGDKEFKVKEGSKPDFLDLNKNGNTKEPMKKAAKDKKNKMSLKESHMEEMCELAKHHAMEYRKAHKSGNLKHCEHHKKNVEECGGKLWHDNLGEVFFSHHSHKNGMPEKVMEFTIGGDHNISKLGKMGAGVAGGYYGSMPGKFLGSAIGGALGGEPGAELGGTLGGVGGALAGGKLAGDAADYIDNYSVDIGGPSVMPNPLPPRGGGRRRNNPIPEKTETDMDTKKTKSKEKMKKESVDRILSEAIRYYLREGEEGKAEVIMAVKDMVDKFTGWSEDIAQMQANTAMEMADSIRDELGTEVSSQFTQVAGPALDSAFQAVKAAREQLNNFVGVLTGQGSAMPMGGGDMGSPSIGGLPTAAPTPSAGPLGASSAPADMGDMDVDMEKDNKRAKRESIERTMRVARILAGQ